MKKPTIIVLLLFVYTLGMSIWGYRQGTINKTEALAGFAVMCVVLTILWFIYRKRERYRNERKKKF